MENIIVELVISDKLHWVTVPQALELFKWPNFQGKFSKSDRENSEYPVTVFTK